LENGAKGKCEGRKGTGFHIKRREGRGEERLARNYTYAGERDGSRSLGGKEEGRVRRSLF